jgi:thioredoxin reductase/Fe-S-cluster-containing hydrogenase component 2
MKSLNYYKWLHGQWPAGKVEKLPVVGEDGATNREGIRIVGDLSGVPLLKFSSETGSKAVQAFLKEPSFPKERSEKAEGVYDLAIIGAGVSGISAAMEASQAGLSYVLIETSEAFSTVKNFPKGKPIFTYPTDMKPSGGIQYGSRSGVKESLLDEMREQVEEAGVQTTPGRVEKIAKEGGTFLLKNANSKEGEAWKALRVVVAIGRSGNYRKLGVPGEKLDKVMNRLHDPKDYCSKKVLIVGGGDSAVESALAIGECGGEVTLSYRKSELTRPKPENVQKALQAAQDGKLNLALGTNVKEITESQVTLVTGKDGPEETLENDAVFAMIGREAPLDFFRRSGLTVSGDRGAKWWITLAISALFFVWLYHWKKYTFFDGLDPKPLWAGLNAEEGSFLATFKNSASQRSFYYTLAYCLCVSIFGYRRVKRRKTPYVTLQTTTLALIQWIPLFILPELLLPWIGANGGFANGGFGQWFGETFLSNGAGTPADQYWRAYGFILAWPLFIYNWFSDAPLWGWLVVGAIQTFVLIPWMVRRWGKGAYCGWICSCGALAETMGDAHRHKMPHGPKVNKLNMIGQVFLWFAAILMVLRIVGWMLPDGNGIEVAFKYLLYGGPISENGLLFFNYAYFVDLIFAGVLGLMFYFHFSGRVWCRFACPLAALMHIYSRFGKFRIFAEKKKCISCNVCTSVCHQGIDVMNFANKGKAMEDPQCVRCSACVQGCPTGVLSFGRYTKGQVDENGELPKVFDTLPASLVQMTEKKK